MDKCTFEMSASISDRVRARESERVMIKCSRMRDCGATEKEANARP